ncbi:hypothetical protein LOD99_14586 [Oopsacas minuta]|uniref:Uncharacterized protein n=1 Tax=Oopsacas minuta TaxID=111878 RepID=A0AAV7KFL6_9METZ|nr:hypothetical protein LOD99_14586 [Oopsacas minuta]
MASQSIIIDGEINEVELSRKTNPKGRAASLANLRVGQPKGPMWSLLRCDDKKSFQIGTKVSHMVACIGSVLYSEDSLFFPSPSQDDWVSPPSLLKSKFLKTSAENTSAKNSFGKRGITHIGVCTLVKANSTQTRKIIDHLLNQCHFKENLKERYPLQISRLEHQEVSSTEFDGHTSICNTFLPLQPPNTLGGFPSSPPTDPQVIIIEDLAGKFAVQLSLPEDGFDLNIVKQFLTTISPHCPLPSTHRLRSVIIPRLYQRAKLEIEDSIITWKSAQIAVDTWLDPSRRSVTYASLLRPLFDPALLHDSEEIEIRNTLYDYMFAPGEPRDHEYYGIQLLQWTKAVSERLKTPVVSFICDGDAALLKGARYARSLCNSKLKQGPPFIVRCFAHLLNLLCHDIINVLGAKVIIKHAGNLSGFFRRGGEENCSLPRKIATMTDVRWNSAYELLDSVAANRHYIEESSRRKKLAPLISDIILSTEFWYGVRKLLEVIRPVCIALNIMQTDSIKFGENIGIIVGISLAFGYCSITKMDKFRVISKCETRLDLLMSEDPNLEKLDTVYMQQDIFAILVIEE